MLELVVRSSGEGTMKVLSLALAAVVLSGACEAKPTACREEVGRETAAVYVRDCMLNSPATHPPCNDANPCWMIVGEVVRSCDLGIPDAATCEHYRGLQKRFPPQTGR
jgi:hypothetical protein